MDKILIIDGHGLAYRAFYAIPPLNAPDGTPTNAITGFMNMLSRAEEDLLPRCCVAVFDAPGPTFRHELLPQYKSTRKPSPDEFKQQVPLLQELLQKMGCPVLVEPGVEADDVIGSLALRAVRTGYQAVILSSDKDLQQVLGDGVTMLRPIKSGVSSAATYDAAGFEAEYGFPPFSVPDYLALLGDTADNVPGVAGVGQKTAAQLISAHRTLEALFESLEELKPAVRKKLEAGREEAFKSRGLIRLKLDLPVDLDACLAFQPDLPSALELAVRLGLSKLVKRLA
ncbi:MAG: DNA polymerase I, partial [Fretibacterium sp.]|nr:DNA polymerase I [Fretibacterium sp.]